MSTHNCRNLRIRGYSSVLRWFPPPFFRTGTPLPPGYPQSPAVYHNSDFNIPETDIKTSESYIYQKCKIDYYEQNRIIVKLGKWANKQICFKMDGCCSGICIVRNGFFLCAASRSEDSVNIRMIHENKTDFARVGNEYDRFCRGTSQNF